MKKRIISLTIAAMMIVATLAGCGNDTTKENTTNNEVVTETPSPETNIPETDAPTTETPTPETNVPETETIDWTYTGTWTFPEDMDGFTRKYENETKPDWSVNYTHYVDVDNNEMNFEWEGPKDLGAKAAKADNTLSLFGTNCELRAWYGGELKIEELEDCMSLDKDIWTTLSADALYFENGYYNVERVGNIVYVKYAVKTNTMTGYSYFICNGDVGNYYMFTYLEDNTNYDDTRAMNVINSIKYWNYIPE